MSIVLVIIGLVIGGVLVGQDLISAATVRSQISQIEKYNTAVRTFQGKYGYLPGDIPNPTASQFGFIDPQYTTTHGNGDGLVGSWNGSSGGNGQESLLFWNDLFISGLVEGSVNPNWRYYGGLYATSIDQLPLFFPKAKLGKGNYIVAWNGGVYSSNIDPGYNQSSGSDGNNYFSVHSLAGNSVGDLTSYFGTRGLPSMSVITAYNIDKKVDDGFPQTGNVIAAHWRRWPGCCMFAGWSGGDYINTQGPNTYASPTNANPSKSAIAGSATTCFDNGNDNTNTVYQHYSTEISGGTNINCGLSFKIK